MGSGDRVLYGMPREDEVSVFSKGGRTMALLVAFVNGLIGLRRVIIAFGVSARCKAKVHDMIWKIRSVDW